MFEINYEDAVLWTMIGLVLFALATVIITL
jgi:hypothetical protein